MKTEWETWGKLLGLNSGQNISNHGKSHDWYITEIFGQAINHISTQVLSVSFPPFAQAAVGKVIISMRVLHDYRTQNPESTAQGSFSCFLHKISQSLRFGLGLASPPQIPHSHLQGIFKTGGRACCSCSTSGLPWAPSPCHTTQNRLEHIPSLHIWGTRAAQVPQPWTPQQTSDSFVFYLPCPFWKHRYKNPWGITATVFRHDKISSHTSVATY